MEKSVEPINREFTINHPIDEVWEAISEPEKLKQWFGSDASFAPYEGAVGYFEWQDECEGRFAMQIESLSAPEYFAFSWMAKENQAFDPDHATLVEWRLRAVDADSTHVLLVESGFKDEQQRASNVEGWDQEIHDLSQMLEFCAR